MPARTVSAKVANSVPLAAEFPFRRLRRATPNAVQALRTTLGRALAALDEPLIRTPQGLIARGRRGSRDGHTGGFWRDRVLRVRSGCGEIFENESEVVG